MRRGTKKLIGIIWSAKYNFFFFFKSLYTIKVLKIIINVVASLQQFNKIVIRNFISLGISFYFFFLFFFL